MVGVCFWGDTGMACNLGYAGIVVLFFLAAVFRRQVALGLLNMNFDIVWSMVITVPIYFLLLFFLPLKWAFFIGLFTTLGGGFIGMFYPILPSGVD